MQIDATQQDFLVKDPMMDTLIAKMMKLVMIY